MAGGLTIDLNLGLGLLIFRVLLVCFKRMSMHAPSELFLGGGVEAARSHMLLFRVFSTAAPIRIEGKIEKEIERQVGIIMRLFWSGWRLMESERRRTMEEKEKWSSRIAFQI